MERKSGVLLPVFSLPGAYGCGGFSAEAKRWIDKLAKGGFSYWQLLPLGIPDSFGSPYMSCSSFGGNPLFIDPQRLFEEGLVSREDLEGQRVENPYLCDYSTLKEKRMSFLRCAAKKITKREDIHREIQALPYFEELCRFLALREQNGTDHHRLWTVTTPDAEEVFFWEFVQVYFHRQWKELHRYATEKGVAIIGDLPFYVSPDSFDVWACPEDYQLDEKGNPKSVAGVPPDYFSENGQKWGNPLYHWENMEKKGFSHWKARLSYQLSLFDGLRLDHFRALSAYWAVPAQAETAKEGEWKAGPGKKFLDAVATVTREKYILAEDLGIIDDDTRLLLEQSGFPGMAVFQFGFDGNPLSPHLPHNYKENLVAYTGTHDNNPFLGFLWEADEKTRREVLAYMGEPREEVLGAVRTLMMSRAETVIFPLQDLLSYGADTRTNTPGTAEGNWQVRFTEEQLDSVNWDLYKEMNRRYGRA